MLHARTASFMSFQLRQLGVLAIRTYIRPQIRYPAHNNKLLFTPTLKVVFEKRLAGRVRSAFAEAKHADTFHAGK